ncbi:hypothetical protein AB0C18_22565 [Nonomuraea muscovyensis]|jgi:hypothetical protein|uniref:hypothetical protein n=1 Tax=Nonomuraea muscovyensis TaxID=1124761 RepID=UPI0033FDE341|nr:putative transrane protein [Nonomuraea muscovyensis]
MTGPARETTSTEEVRLAVYTGFARTGRAPGVPEPAARTGLTPAQVGRELRRLHALWRLARGWYAGRMERGYIRREPATAAAYFAEVGLRGPFWGLPSA